MSTCADLATKAELQALEELIKNKLDKSEKEVIINQSVSTAVPIAITGAISQLTPDITEALTKAKKALGQTVKNASDILKNAVGVAANLSSILGILAQLVILALVLKHEFVDLPRIRIEQKRQDRAIALNQELIFQNRRKIIETENKLRQEIRQSEVRLRNEFKTDIARTESELRKEIDITEARIRADYKADIANSESKLRGEIRQSETRLRNEFRTEISKSEAKLRREFKADITKTEQKLKVEIQEVETTLNRKIEVVQINLELFKVFTNARLTSLEATISGLQNTINGIRSDVTNLGSSKAGKQDLITVIRQVGDVQEIANFALNTAQNSISFTVNTGANSGVNTQDLSTVQAGIKGLQSDIQNLEDTSVQQQQLDTFRQSLVNDFQSILQNTGLIAAPILLRDIQANQLTQNQVRSATETGICNSTRPGGCLNGNLFNPLNAKLNNILNGIGAGASSANLAISNNILNRVTDIQNVVNNSSFGLSAINQFMRNAWQNTKLDKVINVLNTVLALHNALMLSRNLAQTLGDVTTQALQFLGIKDAEGQAIDINSFIGNTINTWITNLIGAETYANIQTSWINLNRIMVAAQGIVYAVQGIKNAVLEGLETVGSWTAKIGNNMIIQGLLEDRSFPWMNENVNFRNPFSRFIQKIENTEEVVSQVNNLVSSGIEAQENFNQIIDNSNELVTSSEELQNNLAQFDLDKEAIEDAASQESVSPEINNRDLIKDEATEVNN